MTMIDKDHKQSAPLGIARAITRAFHLKPNNYSIWNLPDPDSQKASFC
jgi:hypothetical protein